jgi:hypothetical protein
VLSWRLVFLAVIVVAASCASSHSSSDGRVTILEEQTRIMMITEAADGLRDQFGASLDPAKARLVLGADVEKWFHAHNRVIRSLPEPYPTTINRGQQVGLIIDDALPTKSGGRQSVMYLRPPRFGGRRWLVLAQPDPCGDGNPALCERCTGCQGESVPGGIVHTCVCTFSCDDCVPCPAC